MIGELNGRKLGPVVGAPLEDPGGCTIGKLFRSYTPNPAEEAFFLWVVC